MVQLQTHSEDIGGPNSVASNGYRLQGSGKLCVALETIFRKSGCTYPAFGGIFIFGSVYWQQIQIVPMCKFWLIPAYIFDTMDDMKAQQN